MDWKVIVLLFLAVIASGCGDSQTQQGIAVNELDVEPSEIREGNSATVSLEVVNAGLMEGKVYPGEDGENILTNYCSDVFEVTDYSASSSRSSGGENFNLDEGERLRAHWRLKQNKGQIPLPGYTCNLRFEVPFDYSVRAFKQIQVKKNRGVKSADLTTQTSAGPLGIDMEVIGSTANGRDTILEGDDASLYITMYNKGSKKDSPFLGLIEVGQLEVETSGNEKIELKDECGKSGETVELAAGSQKIHRCDLKIDDLGEELSIRGEISANVDYTYVRDLGDKQLKVKKGG